VFRKEAQTDGKEKAIFSTAVEEGLKRKVTVRKKPPSLRDGCSVALPHFLLGWGAGGWGISVTPRKESEQQLFGKMDPGSEGHPGLSGPPINQQRTNPPLWGGTNRTPGGYEFSTSFPSHGMEYGPATRKVKQEMREKLFDGINAQSSG